ncbi:hypothetical protein GAH_00499 [Geoglobus ahangari]|uniref:Uncharacterized protein n=1 Tax=Geoglobus ahangari TaxID=113653 RepID=A0A0F7IGZ6_9EURY|nr:hypothetical protein [Geoglobus ahangari]AKG92154.1 hypothetical protein GAH_00499 [Geoglobus ahangari]
MGEITVRLKIPDEILKQVDLDRVVERLEREIMLEYNLKKLHGKFKDKNLERLLEEVDEEWGI